MVPMAVMKQLHHTTFRQRYMLLLEKHYSKAKFLVYVLLAQL